MSQETHNDIYDRLHQEASLNEGFAVHPHLALQRGADGDLISLISELKTRTSNAVDRFSNHVRTNPWMHVAVASTGALAVGYLLGRAFFKRPAGYDE